MAPIMIIISSWTLLVTLPFTQSISEPFDVNCRSSDRVASENTASHSTYGISCHTSECKDAVNKVRTQLNQGVDPCKNFRKFACGGETVTTSKHSITQRHIESPIEDGDPDYVKKMKRFFQACEDEDVRFSKGTAPYTFSPMASRWPSINPNWNSKGFDLFETLVTYAKLSIQPFFKVVPDKLDEIQGEFIVEVGDEQLWVSNPDFSIPFDFIRFPSNHSTILEAIDRVKKRYMEVAEKFGAKKAVAEEDAENFIALQRKIAEAMPASVFEVLPGLEDTYPLGKVITPNLTFTPMTFKNFQKKFKGNSLDISKVVKAIAANAGLYVPKCQNIYVGEAFLEGIIKLLLSEDPRSIQNFLGFHHAHISLLGLSKKERGIYKEGITHVVEGIQSKSCFSLTERFFRDGLNKLFLDKEITPAMTKTIHDIVYNLKHAGESILSTSRVFNYYQREQLIQKLQGTTLKFPIPDQKVDDADLNKRYSQLSINEDHYSNFQEVLKQTLSDGFFEAIVGTEFTLSGVSARSSIIVSDLSQQQIVFGPGLLVGHSFNVDNPSSLNYGGIGSLIAEHLMMPFNNINIDRRVLGSKECCFDGRTGCFRDQYINYIKGRPSYVLSDKNDAANMVITEGLNVAYRAFLEARDASLEAQTHESSLNLTSCQQFFVAFAQNYCPRSTTNFGSFDSPPNEYKIFSAIQNNFDFANAFNCPIADPMNPVIKCGIW